jgi:hypothetical protein
MVFGPVLDAAVRMLVLCLGLVLLCRAKKKSIETEAKQLWSYKQLRGRVKQLAMASLAHQIRRYL